MYKKNIVAYAMIVPMMLFFLVFLIYPFTKNIIDSFFKFDGGVLDRSPDFVGINNYIELFVHDDFLAGLRNTMILVVLVIIFQVGIALLLALLVNSINKMAKFYKINFFLPIVISATALGLMFSMFYDYDYGMINQIFTSMGQDKVKWLSNEDLVLKYACAVLPIIWQYVGFYFVIFLTGLASIPDELDEAAKMDGCTGIQNVFYVKLPMLRNVISTVLVLAITGSLKVFDLPYVLVPNGHPDGEMHFLGTFMYQIAFGTGEVGKGAAFAVFMVLFGVIMSILSNKIFKKSEDLY